MNASRGWLGPLGWRLMVAFLAVAVGAVALLALVAGVAVDQRTTSLVQAQRTQLSTQMATALSAAYTAGRGSWQPDTLAGVQALAAAHGLHVVVLDSTGRPVATLAPDTPHPDGHHATTPTTRTPAPTGTASSSGTRAAATPAPAPTTHHETAHPSGASTPAPSREHAVTPAPTMSVGTPHDQHDDTTRRHGGSSHAAGSAAPAALLLAGAPALSAATDSTATITVPIVVNGAQVGTARLTLPAGEDIVTAARAGLLRSVGLGAALAVLLAAGAAVIVSRRVTRPLVELTDAARSFAVGGPEPERMLRPAPGELGVLGRAFTTMAATVRHQEELRRAVVADVAHEMRTPVTILRGETEQLLDGTADPTPARLVSLHDEVLRLERVTDDLATLSAADAAGLALHPDTVDLGALTTRSVQAMSSILDEADLHHHVEAADHLLVRGDATRLTQVVTNLLTNAAKFTPPGGTISVAAFPDGPDAVLTVADTGPGIPADEIPHVFERFWRGRAAGGRSGTGIGLAVVHTLVTAHGGTVTVVTPAQGGALFTIRLPLAVHPAGQGPSGPATTPRPVLT